MTIADINPFFALILLLPLIAVWLGYLGIVAISAMYRMLDW